MKLHRRLPILIVCSVLIFASSCARARFTATPAPPFHSGSGKIYARAHVAPSDNDEPVNIPPVPPGGAPSADNFHGSARMAAKLSIAQAHPESFSDLGDLLGSLVSDAKMRAMGISMASDSGRVSEEEKIVTVTAFLYAASKESDNDFHCILGRDPGKPKRFMNVEVSGLPPSSNSALATLRKARNEFKAFFTSNEDSLPTSGYDKYDPPIPVKVTGSLFFDVDHPAGTIGPTGMRPKTAWEIHPVSDIQFEQ